MIMAKYADQPVSHNILDDSELTELQDFLSQYNKDTIPAMYFKAWDIMILGGTGWINLELIIKKAWIKFKGL